MTIKSITANMQADGDENMITLEEPRDHRDLQGWLERQVLRVTKVNELFTHHDTTWLDFDVTVESGQKAHVALIFQGISDEEIAELREDARTYLPSFAE